jgi:hypothetical protein
MKKTLKLALVALSLAMLPALAVAQVTAVPTVSVISFNPATVGVAAGSAQQLMATFAVSGYTGSFTPTATLHYGHDYSAGAVNCTATGGSENCSVAITFQPTLPGARRDAIFLWNGSTRLASVLLGGIGQAPLALIQPGVLTTSVPSSSDYIYNVTVDENDTAYYVTNTASIYSITKGGVVTQIPITGLSGGTLVGLAVDGAGVLYISPYNYGKALLTYDTVTGTQGTLPMAPPAPYAPCDSLEYLSGAATDAFGNVFTYEILCNEIFERKADGTFVTTPLNPIMIQPYRVAVDQNDNVFIGGYKINKLTSGGTQSLINSIGASEGIAVDAADSLYATRYLGAGGVGGVAELPASDYTTYQASLDTAASPLGLGLASDGTLFVGNYNNLDKVDRTQGKVDFGNVPPTGTPAATQYVGVYNGGNEILRFTGYTLTGDTVFAMQAAASNPCVNGLVLAPGEQCQVGVNATSTHGGTYSGTITFTTNSLNTTTTQTVALTAFTYGVYMVPSPTALTFGNQNTGTTSTAQTVTMTNDGYYYAGSVGAATVPSSVFSVTVPPACNSVAVGASCQVSVTFTPSAAQTYNGTVTLPVSSSGGGTTPSVTFTVNGTGVNPLPVASLSPALSFPSTNAGSTATALAATLSNTGSVSLTGITPNITGTNPSDFAVTTGANACGSTLAATSTCNIYVTFTPAGGSAYSATLSVADNAASSPQMIALTGAGVLGTQTISFTQPSSPVTYSSGLTVLLVATGGASGNPIVFTIDTSSTGTGTISSSTLTVTKAGNIVIDANQAGNTNYSAAAQVRQTIVVQAAQADFSITPSPLSQSVAAGGNAAFAITAASVTGNFTTPIQLSVSGLPSGATAVFSPASITLGSESPNTSTLTVTTAAQMASNKSGLWPLGAPALALLVFIPFRRGRSFWRGKLLLLFAAFITLAASLSLTACGGGFAFPITSHSYTLTITGTGGTDTHTATVQLTVQN